MVFACQSDVTPYYLVTSQGGKLESRGLPHKCRNYSKLSHSIFDTMERSFQLVQARGDKCEFNIMHNNG